MNKPYFVLILNKENNNILKFKACDTEREGFSFIKDFIKENNFKEVSIQILKSINNFVVNNPNYQNKGCSFLDDSSTLNLWEPEDVFRMRKGLPVTKKV